MVIRSDRPQKTAMIIARRIVSDIHRQGLGPGDHLPSEKVMLEQYQVGRGTLRESLRFLELSGAISLKPGPGGGPIVGKPDASDLKNSLGLLLQFEGARFETIVEARVGLEPLMARLAAERITAAQRVRLEGAVAMMRSNIADLEVFFEANRSFHNAIAWASGNALFGFLIDAMDGVFEGAALRVDYPEPQRLHVLEADETIFEAIITGNPDRAETVMRVHVAEWMAYLHKKHPVGLAKPITWDALR